MRRLIFCLWLLVPATAFPATVDSLRAWHGPDQTRLVLDLSGPTGYQVFTVGNPERVVIDLATASVPANLKLPPLAQPRVRGVRYAGRPPGGARVVFDLAHPMTVRSALLSPQAAYGHRLVIDLVDDLEPRSGETDAVAPPAARAPAVEATIADASSSADTAPPVLVAVDAGHGGDDVGAIGPRGTYEKDVVLAIARELVRLLNAEPGMRGVLTRDGDYYVGLRDRMVRARRHKADLFVSIHADAFRNRRIQGSSVYVLSPRGASSEAARWLAEKENAADLVGGVSLDDKDDMVRSVLLDLSQTASMQASLDVADNVLGALRRVGNVHHARVQSAGFMVLKSPDIPSLLVETAFISNPNEEQKLRNAAFRTRLASAVRDGIKAYFAARPAPAGRYAEERQHRVGPGDTLAAIAERYEVSAKQIQLANNLPDETVRLGEILRIP